MQQKFIYSPNIVITTCLLCFAASTEWAKSLTVNKVQPGGVLCFNLCTFLLRPNSW